MKKYRPFQFKQFSVCHSRSALKVGVDGVLVGAWTSVPTTVGARILDVGTGCGLIALMLAQRTADISAEIVGIEVDRPSIEECGDNFCASLWSERLAVVAEDFMHWNPKEKFDLIVSNPPYFMAGADAKMSARMAARHADEFSPDSLLVRGVGMLNDGGKIAMIVPSDQSDLLAEIAGSVGLRGHRRCMVRGHEEAPWKRCLLEFVKSEEGEVSSGLYDTESQLTIEHVRGVATDEYSKLCCDFYLKF